MHVAVLGENIMWFPLSDHTISIILELEKSKDSHSAVTGAPALSDNGS